VAAVGVAPDEPSSDALSKCVGSAMARAESRHRAWRWLLVLLPAAALAAGVERGRLRLLERDHVLARALTEKLQLQCARFQTLSCQMCHGTVLLRRLLMLIKENMNKLFFRKSY
jgi:hypothetical protein